MLKRIISLVAMLVATTLSQPLLAEGDDLVRVRMKTSEGDIVLQLNRSKAPETVKNFLAYVESGFYEGTIFHRVINNFMIQGGGYTQQYKKKSTRLAIKNEAYNGLKNTNGTIAMARTNDPHSATAQFFINVKDNDFLNHSAPTPRGWGYAVFGKVVEGMDIVNKIKRIPTSFGGPFRSDVPKTAVVIHKVSIESK